MKHLLNDLSDEEKNNIRNQHTGGMKVMTESFSRLLNSKLGDSKPLVTEEKDEDQSQPFLKRIIAKLKGISEKKLNTIWNMIYLGTGKVLRKVTMKKWNQEKDTQAQININKK